MDKKVQQACAVTALCASAYYAYTRVANRGRATPQKCARASAPASKTKPRARVRVADNTTIARNIWTRTILETGFEDRTEDQILTELNAGTDSEPSYPYLDHDEDHNFLSDTTTSDEEEWRARFIDQGGGGAPHELIEPHET